MDIKIVVMDGEVGKSRIVEGKKKFFLEELPDRLQEKILYFLKTLKNIFGNKFLKSIFIERDIENSYIEFSECNRIVSNYVEDIQDQFKKTFSLLQWYLGHAGSQWESDGIADCCKDCSEFFPAGRHEKFCPEPECPSHKMWEQIDSNYKRPVENSAGTIIETTGGAGGLNAIRAFKVE